MLHATIIESGGPHHTVAALDARSAAESTNPSRRNIDTLRVAAPQQCGSQTRFRDDESVRDQARYNGVIGQFGTPNSKPHLIPTAQLRMPFRSWALATMSLL